MPRDEDLLIDMLAASKRILRHISGVSFNQFLDDEKLQDAVIWQIAVIGEAARNLSASFKELYPKIPLFEMAGMRNRLIHDYKRIDFEQVWDTVRKSVPEFIAYIEPLIPPADRPE